MNFVMENVKCYENFTQKTVEYSNVIRGEINWDLYRVGMKLFVIYSNVIMFFTRCILKGKV